MPITTSYAPITYQGDGVANAFVITFPYQLQTDLIVQTLNTSTQALTTLVLGVGYTVSPTLNSPAGTGTVTTTTPPAVGIDLIIKRNVPVTQDTSWVPNDPNLSTSTMNAVDKLTMIIQDVQANPFDLGGDASTFLRGDNTLANTLIGASGAVTLPADTTALFTAQQNASASIKVAGGATSQTAFSYGVGGSANPWDARWVYDPNIAAIGWQFFGGPIKGTFTSSGLDVIGTVNATLFTGAADASLITTGVFNVARVGTSSGNANTFLNGTGAFSIPASGGGGIGTTTTGPFTIAAVSSTQTVPVTSATGITAGTYLQISDGTHTIIGLVTVVASLNLTVQTTNIVLGIAGNTMASGAAVQSGFAGSNNSITVQDASVPPTSATGLVFGGSAAAGGSLPGVSLYTGATGGGTMGVSGYLLDVLKIGNIKTPTLNTSDYLAVARTGASHWDAMTPASTGQVVIASAPGTLTFGTIGAASVTAGSLTPPLLQATNSPSSGQVPSYGDSTHFTWVNPLLATGTDAQFIRADGVNTNTLDGPIRIAGLTPISGTQGVLLTSFTSPKQATFAMQQFDGVSTWNQTATPQGYLFDGPVKVIQNGDSYTNIDGSGAIIESGYFGGVIRTTKYGRSAGGWWTKVVEISNPTGTNTLDPATASYYVIENVVSSFTIALTDSNANAGTSFPYAGELTIEFRGGVGANVVTWPAITWVDGGSAPTPSASDTTIIKLIRVQNIGDGFGARWIGYRAFISSSGGSGTVTSITAGSGLSGGTITTSGTVAIAPGGVTASMIANNTITNAQIASGANIAVNKLSLPGGTANFLRADGSWAPPPGTGGGGGGPTLAGTQTWTGVNTYTNNNLFNGRNVFTGPQIFNAGAFDGGNATGSVAIMGTYPTDPVAPFQAAGISTNITNNDSVNGGNVLALLVQQTNSSSAATSGTGAACFNVNSQCNNTGGFSIALQERAWYAKINGGVGDGIWLNSWGPSISYQSTPDSNGITHSFGSGFVRIGEVNYGNGWMDFGFIQNPAAATQSVSGIWFIPDYLPAGFGGTSANPKFNAQWAIVIGAATSTFSSANVAKHWTGLLIDQDAVDHLGLDINCRGGSTSGNAPGAALNIQNNYVTGINFSGSGGTTNGGTSATFSSTGNAAITMAVDQSIKLGTVYLRGHGASHPLQYSTDGVSWSDVTLP